MPGIAVPVPESFRSVESLLGGRGVLRAKPRSTLDWIESCVANSRSGAGERLVGIW